MINKKQTNKLITQLDYIKVLLEEDRMGEALNYTKILSNGLETECEKIANSFDTTKELLFTKKDMKTKPGYWLYVDHMWFKLLEKTNDSIHLEVSKNIEIKTKYSIINERE